jgi:hypothetical protein
MQNLSSVRTTQEIEEVDSSVRIDYETRLADALRQLREESDEKLFPGCNRGRLSDHMGRYNGACKT